MGRLVIRTVWESAEFTKQCEVLGGAYRLDDALRGFNWILSTQPELYPVLPGLKTTRLVTTDSFIGLAGTSPRLRVYFRILNDNDVEMLWIEEDLTRRGYEHW